MPELPEVETTTVGLRKRVVGLTIADVWTDLAVANVTRADYVHTIKHLPFFKQFAKDTRGVKIVSAERRAKNILINLENEKTVLVHMKMTGHLMYGEYAYDKKSDSWKPADTEKNVALRDPYNRFVHFVFTFTNGKHLVFCDTRKFGKITIEDTAVIHTGKHLAGLGPEPLAKNFTSEIFRERLRTQPSQMFPCMYHRSVFYRNLPKFASITKNQMFSICKSKNKMYKPVIWITQRHIFFSIGGLPRVGLFVVCIFSIHEVSCHLHVY